MPAIIAAAQDSYNRPAMSLPVPRPARIALDNRLGAYRRAGIAAHVARLVEGLEQVAPPEEVLLLEHRRARYGSAWRHPLARPQDAAGSLSPKSSAQGSPAPAGAEPSADSDRAPTAAARPRIRTRFLWTPPHHRWEGRALPLELALGGGADLLHAPDVVVPVGWRGPAVATVHDVTFLDHPEFLDDGSLRYYAGIHGSLRRAGRVIVVSDHTCRALLARTGVDPRRVVVVPNAVAPRFAAPADPEADRAVGDRYGLSSRYVLFVGTIEPRKNVGVLLAAFRRLLDEGLDLDLALAGADGWHSGPVYEAARALGLEGRARFLGYVPDEDLAALYRRAAVLAHPALDEGFGLTPLEAMAAGTPVVVAEAGSLGEVVGEAGLRVPPGDPAAWSGALAALLRDGELARRLGEAGRERAAAFTPRRMAEATLAVYRAALAEHEGAGRR
jgi:glycosyltransferase involved in cell wall biosynthesis